MDPLWALQAVVAPAVDVVVVAVLAVAVVVDAPVVAVVFVVVEGDSWWAMEAAVAAAVVA